MNTSSDFTTRPRVQRVRHEIHRRDVTVVRVEPLGAHLVAITFGGESLAGFVSLSFDDHVKFIVDGPDGTPVRRDYTPRHFDAARRELTIVFALHGDGPSAVDGVVSAWARRAVLGSPAVIAGPRGSMVIDPDHDWHLLAGDLTALPAIERRLEELPADTPVQAVLLVPDAADRRALASPARLDLTWVATPDALVDAIAALQLPAGTGFAWCAGEAALMARVRQTLVAQHGLPREAMRVSAYWKPGAADFHATLDA